MRKGLRMAAAAAVSIALWFLAASPSGAQTKEERQFMKQHEQEMTTFMEKCTGCHSAQRILAKKMSREEVGKLLKVMADKPHAGITPEELRRIQKWSEFMQSTISPRP